MLQLITCFFILLCQVKNEQLFDFQLFSGLSHLSCCWWGFPGHRFSGSSWIFDFLLKVADNFLQITKIIFKLSNLGLNLLLLALIIGGFQLHRLSFLMDNGCIFLDLLLFSFLLSHLSSNNGELLPYLLNNHLRFFADLYLLGFDDFLFLVVPLQFLNLFLCVIDLLSLIFNWFLSIFDRFLFVHDVNLQLTSINLLTANHVLYWLDCCTHFFCDMECFIFLCSQLLDLSFLLLHLFPEGGAYLLLPVDFFPQIL